MKIWKIQHGIAHWTYTTRLSQVTLSFPPSSLCLIHCFGLMGFFCSSSIFPCLISILWNFNCELHVDRHKQSFTGYKLFFKLKSILYAFGFDLHKYMCVCVYIYLAYISNMQYSSIDYSHCDVHYISRTYLLTGYLYLLIPFSHFTPFHTPTLANTNLFSASIMGEVVCLF